jgi:hypothetical protein
MMVVFMSILAHLSRIITLRQQEQCVRIVSNGGYDGGDTFRRPDDCYDTLHNEKQSHPRDSTRNMEMRDIEGNSVLS